MPSRHIPTVYDAICAQREKICIAACEPADYVLPPAFTPLTLAYRQPTEDDTGRGR